MKRVTMFLRASEPKQVDLITYTGRNSYWVEKNGDTVNSSCDDIFFSPKQMKELRRLYKRIDKITDTALRHKVRNGIKLKSKVGENDA